MNIKLMIIEDYKQIYDLWTSEKGVGLRSIDDSKEGIDKFLKRNPTTCFVAQKDDRIIGSILCGNDGRRGYIYHAMVWKKRRGQGIGKALVDAATNALKDEGIHKAALVVFCSNELGNKFWENIGFSKRDDLVYRNLSLNEGNE